MRNRNELPLFSVVIPVYQNESNLPDTIPKLLGLRQALPGWQLELVFVDDGSTDRSPEILRDFQRREPGSIVVLRLSRNFGQTPAVQAGLRYARGAAVGIISADLQEPYERFPEMLAEWQKGAKFVIGERVGREEGLAHQIISSIYWRLIRRFAFPDFPRMGYDFFLIDRQVVNELNKIDEKNSSIYCLTYWLGFKPARIPIVRRIRERGQSQWHLRRRIRITIDTLVAFTTVPSRLITFSAFFLGASCLLFLLVMLWMWIEYRAAPPGWMTVIGLLTLLGAMLLFALGIVSEYLLRILQELKRRPTYVVEEALRGDDVDKL